MIPQSEIQPLRAAIAEARAKNYVTKSIIVNDVILEKLLDVIEIRQTQESQRRRAVGEKTPSGGHAIIPSKTVYSPVTVVHRTADQDAEHAIFMDGVELKTVGRFKLFVAAEATAKAMQAAYNDGWLHGQTDIKGRVARAMQ